ncbi:hypothetical protein EON82_10110 [bacterium]|nr:MAG: hypothetical protein EON82_10110 [bacterium]
MTDEHADRYVSNALSFHDGWDTFEVVAGERSLPTLVEAFARRGWTATAQAKPGVLLVSRAESDVPPSGRADVGPEML